MSFSFPTFLKLLPLALSLGVSTLNYAQSDELKPIKEVWEPKGNFPADKFLKVAVLQWAPAGAAPIGSKELAESFKQNNRSTLAEYIKEAAAHGAKLILTPEFGVIGYPDIPELENEDDNFRNRDDIAPYVETIEGTSVQFFKKLALELKVGIHFGFALKEGTKYFNAVVAIDSKGEVVAIYRKMHLYQNEAKYLSAGTKPATYMSAVGKVGFLICSDSYDSELLRHYRNEKVDVLALSTSWAQYNTGWGYFTRASAAVNAPLLASNHNYFPDSGVIFPDGTSQSHIRQSTGVAYGYLPLKK